MSDRRLYDFDVRGSVDADDVHSDVHEALQPTLFDGASEPAFLLAPTSRIERNFARFHRLNPTIYAKLEQLALDAYRRGVRKLGIDLLYARLRWDFTIETRGDSLKLNADYRALYSRLLKHRRPELATMFVTRGRREKGRVAA